MTGWVRVEGVGAGAGGGWRGDPLQVLVITGVDVAATRGGTSRPVTRTIDLITNTSHTILQIK